MILILLLLQCAGKWPLDQMIKTMTALGKTRNEERKECELLCHLLFDCDDACFVNCINECKDKHTSNETSGEIPTTETVHSNGDGDDGDDDDKEDSSEESEEENTTDNPRYRLSR